MILRDSCEAEDAVHDAAIQAWPHWHDLREQDRLDAWFDRILINECRARLRRARLRPLMMDVPEGIAPDVLSAIGEREVLHSALACLDADHRTSSCFAMSPTSRRTR